MRNLSPPPSEVGMFMYMTITIQQYSHILVLCYYLTFLFQVFDAGSSFGMLKVLHADSDSEEKEEEESEYSWQVVVSAEDGIEESDENK